LIHFHGSRRNAPHCSDLILAILLELDHQAKKYFKSEAIKQTHKCYTYTGKTKVLVLGPKILRYSLSNHVVILDGITSAPSLTVRNVGMI